VDLSLFSCSAKNLTREIIKIPSAYIALGELKGGIDPAGADEHWKTARTALNRIHEAFLNAETQTTHFLHWSGH
jgi:type II restriction enzyme